METDNENTNEKIIIFNAKTQGFSKGKMAVPSEFGLPVYVAMSSATSCMQIFSSGHIHKCI